MSTVNVGDTAEENSDTSPGLPAIEGAIDRLLILSVNIRRSARQTNRLRQGNGNAQDESLCRLLVQRRYPHARKSLCSQLSASICARGRSLQYLQEHNKKLAYQRENQEDAKELVNNEGKPEEELDAQAVPIGDVASRKRKASQGPETLPSMVSSSAIVRLNRTRRIPTSTIISKGSTVQDSQGNDYDYPPWPKEKHGKRYQSCTICAMPLDVLTLTKRAWEYVFAFLDIFNQIAKMLTGLMLTKTSSLTSAYLRIALSLLSTLPAFETGWIICRCDTL